MDHPFLSVRKLRDACDEKLQMCLTAESICKMTRSDRTLLACRRDARIANEEARRNVARYADRIGLLLELIDHAPLLEHGDTWSKVLLGEDIDLSDLVQRLSATADALRAEKVEFDRTETRSASSSYSDYSDSSTRSESPSRDRGRKERSDTEESDTEESDTETTHTSEGTASEDTETPPKCAKRRR